MMGMSLRCPPTLISACTTSVIPLGRSGNEPLDQNQPTWSPQFHCGNRRFLTTRLWGVANQPPFFHHGLFTTLRESILAHHGEAEASRAAFLGSSEYERDSLVEFLKTLQVLPPDTRNLTVDESFRRKAWSEHSAALSGSGSTAQAKPPRNAGLP